MTRSIKLSLVTLALALAAPAAAAPRAAAQSTGPQLFSAWLVLDPGPVDGVGVGVRAMVPLVPEGLLGSRSVRDELVLDLGADFVHYSDRVGAYGYYLDYTWNGLLPVVGLEWNFWLNRNLALYPKLDLGYWIGWYSGWDNQYGYSRPGGYGGFFIEGAVGLIYKLPRLALRAEVGSGLLRLGVAFPF